MLALFKSVAAVSAPLPFSMSNIIAAGSNDEVASDDLLEWTKPLLNGLEHGHWASLQLEFVSDSEVFVRFHSGISDIELNLYEVWSEAEVAAFRDLLPSTDQVLVLAMDNCENQAMSLLDGVANWLMLLDAKSLELTPLNRMFQYLWKMANKIGQRA